MVKKDEKQKVVGAKGEDTAKNAKAAFTNFSLVKKVKTNASRLYIDPKKDLSEQQSTSMSRQIQTLTPVGPGLRINAKDLSSLKASPAGVIDINTLIDALQKGQSGTQFYTSSTDLAERMSTQTQIDQFFATLKGKPNGNGA